MARGLTQGDVARRGGIHESVVGKIERGTRRAVGEQPRRLARGLRANLRSVLALCHRTSTWRDRAIARKSRP